MSYDITFKKNLGFSKNKDFNEQIIQQGELFVFEEKKKILNAIKDEFPTATINMTQVELGSIQVSIYDYEIALSIPYWAENIGNKNIDELVAVLLNHSLIGFDVQIGGIIDKNNQGVLSSFSKVFDSIRPQNKIEEEDIDEEKIALDVKKYIKTIEGKIEILISNHTECHLDFSPKSLKKLEQLYFSYVDENLFTEELSKEDFQRMIPIYKAKVYIENQGFEWAVQENFMTGKMSLVIESRGGHHTIFLSEKRDLEKFRAKNKNQLFKDYNASA